MSCGFIFCIHTISEYASIDEGSWNHGMSASKVFWNFAGPIKKGGKGVEARQASEIHNSNSNLE